MSACAATSRPNPDNTFICVASRGYSAARSALPVKDGLMTRRMIMFDMSRPHRAALFLTALAAAACGGGESQPAAGGNPAAAFPPTDVKTITLEAKPIAQSSEFVATIRSL